MKKIRKMNNRKGEGYVGSGVKILIAVVLGALLLSGLYALQKNVIIQGASNKVEELFAYNGGNTPEISPSTYEVISISPQTVSTDDYMTITIGIPYDDFDYFTIDGEDMSSESCISACDYDECTAIISMPPFIETLSPGEHTLRAYAKDGGFAEVTFIKE